MKIGIFIFISGAMFITVRINFIIESFGFHKSVPTIR